jgi:hypothetical protein
MGDRERALGAQDEGAMMPPAAHAWVEGHARSNT